MAVLGRDAELRQIADWLLPEPVDSPPAGTGAAVLVIEGQPGIGKTTLWAEAVRLAGQQGWRVLSCRPVPSDAGLPHVGLADLLRPVPGEAFGGLPPPQQRALGVALLREEAPDRDLDPGRWARVLLELGSVLWAQGPWKEGMALISQALSEAGAPALRARIHSRISALADDIDVSVEHGEAALALLDQHEDPQLYSFALHNVALFRLYAGRGADHEAIETGMRLQQEAAAWEMSTVPAYWARNLDDFTTARERFEDLVRAMRQHGDEATVSGALSHLAVIEALTGHMDRARGYAAEALDLARQTEQQTLVNMALSVMGDVLARAGELGEARRVAGELLGRLDSYPDIVLEGRARAALGHAALTAGDLAEADKQFSRADAICESLHIRDPAADRFHADHAEAVIGLGDLDRAGELVRRMEARAAALPRPWILAVSARSRGLLSAAAGQPGAAHADYERALAACRTLEVPSERGRTLLALGRLHRRGHMRQRAEASFAEAAGVFRAAGAVAWADIATNEQRRAQGKRGNRDRLTPTERRIAELAGAGQRNQEIAARLFVSPKTVEANLSRVYSKLGIRSRAELAHHLAVADGAETRQP